ncbi:MAG: tetraacyldisaccharide 4'-kinase, partial [Comamonadaceae bacterium]
MTIVAQLTRWVMRQWQVTGWFCRVMTPLACLTGMVVA